ncbi:MAG: hypothetical protein H6644_13160 [Caldilineaceae bacterium]|nr:hypothetical protein [Caldilineaceae bacterium]
MKKYAAEFIGTSGCWNSGVGAVLAVVWPMGIGWLGVVMALGLLAT